MSEPNAPVTALVAVVPGWQRARLELGSLTFALSFLAAFVALFVVSAVHHAGGPTVLAALLGVAAVAGLLGASVWLAASARPRENVALVADRAGLRLGARFIARARLLEASVAPSPAAASVGARIEVVSRGAFSSVTWIDVETADRARAIVAALGLGADQRVMTRWLRSKLRGRPARFLLATCVVGGMFLFGWLSAEHGPGRVALLGALAWLGLALAPLVLAELPTRVTIGADGLTERWLGLRHTTALRDITRVEIVHPAAHGWWAVHVQVASARPRELAVRGRAADPSSQNECVRLLERLQAALTSARAGAPMEFHEWTERHATLAPHPWIAALRRDAAAYRDAPSVPFSPAELWRALEDGRLDPLARAAAAVALGARFERSSAERLRDVAQATAVSELAAVFHAASASDDDALARAVTRLRRALGRT